ncbi:MerR family transcriptional regulator [Paramicrobacterium chengjingii]|uniref:MerR family transcriptional regulator n=1 Tax=Paramicrobacterium chengjingii TaxID=2769067 RepID=A0ABX6YHF4_9MICO|nr:MerR family transcriptional regulator [Microbacterium chengjingii]QPZ38135.1 MerR family transcriptional regulator [Microbacterium chengjingii]
MLSIGAVAQAAGVTPRVVRYYEQHGLIASDRTAGGQRRYPESAIERVQFIQQLIRAGLTTAVIHNLLGCVNTRVATPETIAQLTSQREVIAARADELNRMKEQLDGLIGSAQETLAPADTRA